MPSFIRPEFFDIFGIPVFIFFIVIAMLGLKTNKPLPQWALVYLLIIGVIGFLVDAFNVYSGYLK